MVLLGTVILPHCSVLFDGNPNSEAASCESRHKQLSQPLKDSLSAVYQGICAAGKRIAELEPDLIILNTPHGICLSDSLGIYLNGSAEGDALWNGEWREFTVKVKLDAGRSEELRSFWKQHDVPVQGIRSYVGLECKLRWGEVVPLWFLQKFLTKEAKYIITTDDLKPKSSTVDEWRLSAGKRLTEFVANLPEKVVIAISGDLAQFHPTDCTDPLYLPDPNIHLPSNRDAATASKSYDKAIAAWIENKENTEGGIWNPTSSFQQLTIAINQEPIVCACGSKGFQLLHGAMAEAVARGAKFKSQIIAHGIPSYFGMISSVFIKQ